MAATGHTAGGAADRSRFGWVLVALAVVAFGIRVALAFYRPRPAFLSDATYYRLQGVLIADGHGFVDPFVYILHHRAIPTAFHPPLMSLVYAVPSWFGWTGIDAARITTSLIGTGTVVAIGFLGRQLGGVRVGVIAACIAVLTPNLLAPDTNLHSEGAAALLVALALLAAYRLLERPRAVTALLLGAALGAAGLARPESLGIAVFAVVPLVVRRTVTPRRRIALTVLVAIGIAVVAGPWVVRSLTRFDRPVPFSTNGIAVVGYANCPLTYSGALLGDWTQRCPPANERYLRTKLPTHGDESVLATKQSDLGTRYLRSHVGEFFGKVLWARIGRTWSLYRPFDAATAHNDEGKLESEMVIGVLTLWASVVLGGIALVTARRSRAFPILPMIGPSVVVTLITVAAYGSPRFRVIAEPSLIVLAAIGATVVWDRFRQDGPPAVADAATRRPRPSPTR